MTKDIKIEIFNNFLQFIIIKILQPIYVVKNNSTRSGFFLHVALFLDQQDVLTLEGPLEKSINSQKHKQLPI
jgi:hypothetical protein